MRLQCFTHEWYGYALYAGIMGVLYVVGLPLSIAVILVKRRRTLFGDGSAETRRVWGFLYEAYGPVAWWWEVEELLRKLFLTAFVVLMDPGSPLQVTLAVLFSGWAHVLHAVYKPWRVSAKASENVTYLVQHGSLFVTSCVFLMGLLFKVEGVLSTSPVYEALSVVMLLLCIGFVAWWSYEMFSGVAAKRCRLRRRADGTESGARTECVERGRLSSPSPSSGGENKGSGTDGGLWQARDTSSASDKGPLVDAAVVVAAATEGRRDHADVEPHSESITLSRRGPGVGVCDDPATSTTHRSDTTAAAATVTTATDVRASLHDHRGTIVTTNPMHVRRVAARVPSAPSGDAVGGGGLAMYFHPRTDPRVPPET
jgi:hypothetical protein